MKSEFISKQTRNALISNNIKTIEDLMAIDEQKLAQMKRIGKSTLEEIMELRNQYLTGDIQPTESALSFTELDSNISIIEYAWGMSLKENSYIIKNRSGETVFDLPISVVGFSNRATNIFTARKLDRLSVVAEFPFNKLTSLKALGQKTIQDIIEAIKQHTEICGDVHFRAKQATLTKQLVSYFHTDIYQNSLLELENLAAAFISKCQLNEVTDSAFNEFFNEDDVQQFIANKIIEFINVRKNCKLHELDAFFPGKADVFQKSFVENLLHNKEIGYFGEYYTVATKSFETLLREKKCLNILEYIAGNSLRTIAAQRNLSHERVRQLIGAEFKKIGECYETVYFSFFKKYDTPIELFEYLKFDKYSLYYFEQMLRSHNGTLPLADILFDMEVPPAIRHKVDQFLHRNEIDINGTYIPRTRDGIMNYILQQNCRKYTTQEQFKRYYDDFLAKYVKNASKNLECVDVLKIKLSNMPNSLWVLGEKFRYYEIDKNDLEDLLDEIGFYTLNDVEISTKYFVDRYKETLEEYDIHDEYELHNILKKNLPKDSNVSFGRMPYIMFGNANRQKQVEDLLRQEAPIDIDSLAEKYGFLYGTTVKTFRGAFVKEIAKYYSKGIYRTDFVDLNEIEYKYLRNILTDSWYEIQQIKNIFIKKFPNEDHEKINTYVLRQLGFFIYGNIVYKYKSPNFEKFFEDFLDKNEELDFTNKLWQLRPQGVYIVLHKRKTDLDIFEYEHHKFISIKALKAKLPYSHGKECVRNFITKAIDHAKDNIFTVQSLKATGFSHELLQLDYGDFFFNSILKSSPDTSYLPLGNTIVFSNKNTPISHEIIMLTIMGSQKSINVDELTRILQDNYGIVIPQSKMKNLAEKAGMYYSSITKKVYQSYEDFQKDV